MRASSFVRTRLWNIADVSSLAERIILMEVRSFLAASGPARRTDALSL